MFHVSYEYMQVTGVGVAGWTENFWCGLSTLPAALAAADALGVYLRYMHSDQAQMLLHSVRQVSDDPGSPDPRLGSSVAHQDSPAVREARLAGMFPTTALRISIYDVEGRSNDVWLKGMPDGLDTNGFLSPPAAWLARANTMLGILMDPTFGFVRRALDTSQPKRFVTSITNLGVVTTQGPHGYTTGNWVRVGRTTSSPNVDGLYRVTVGADVNQFTLVGFPTVSGPPVVSNASYSQRQLFIPTAITNAVMEGVTKKNVGRPRGGPRGRQKTPRS